MTDLHYCTISTCTNADSIPDFICLMKRQMVVSRVFSVYVIGGVNAEEINAILSDQNA